MGGEEGEVYLCGGCVKAVGKLGGCRILIVRGKEMEKRILSPLYAFFLPSLLTAGQNLFLF